MINKGIQAIRLGVLLVRFNRNGCGCGGLRRDTIVVGSKNFSEEQALLGEIIAAAS